MCKIIDIKPSLIKIKVLIMLSLDYNNFKTNIQDISRLIYLKST